MQRWRGSFSEIYDCYAKIHPVQLMLKLWITAEENLMARTPIHPGEQLEALNMSAAELGRQLNVPTNRITSILKVQRAITGDTALRLGHFFNSNPQFWLNLQAIYDLRLAEQKVGVNISRLPTLVSRAKRSTATA